MANHPLCQRSAAGGVPREATGRSQSRPLVNEAEWSPALPSLCTEPTPLGFCLFACLPYFAHFVSWVCTIFSKEFILKKPDLFKGYYNTN